MRRATSTGVASSVRPPPTRSDQTNSGARTMVMPGARKVTMVVRMLTKATTVATASTARLSRYKSVPTSLPPVAPPLAA